MRKIMMSAVLVLVMLGGGIVGCAAAPAAPPPPPTLQPLTIELIDIPVRYCSADSAMLILNFKVHNPNSFEVAVENFNYYMTSPDFPHEPGDELAFQELIRDSIFRTQYIPGGKDIEISDKVLIVYRSVMLAQLMARAIAPSIITGEVIPPFWEQVDARTMRLHVEGDIYVVSDYGTLDQDYAFDYKGTGWQTGGPSGKP